MSDSIFEILKEKVSIVDAVERYVRDELVSVGTATFSTSDKVCPFTDCNHKDCFRVKFDEEDPENSFFNCFSCDKKGDVVSFVSQYLHLEPIQAALTLAKDFNVDIPSTYSPVQEIMDLAATYYHNCLLECRINLSALGNITPMDYQLQVRKHTEGSIRNLRIGFSDGGLVTFLESMGFDSELIEESGLKGKKGDYLPANCFIYPHFVKGRASHFTFKDPNKRLGYQLPNKFRLNDVLFYNQDSVRDKTTVAIVEGENDLISLIEGGWEHGVVATIGQISNAQIKWLSENLEGKDVFDFFDSDKAGDKYREKLTSLRTKTRSLVHIKVPEESEDIDKFLKEGGLLSYAIEAFSTEANIVVKGDGEVEDLEVSSLPSSPILEKNNAYFKIKFDKDQQPYLDKVSDFTLELRNVYILKDQRLREVVATRDDGKKSQPLLISSNDKVSTKNFKPFIANAVDGSFYGGDIDLINMWKLVYEKGNEREVRLPTVVGHIPDLGGWLCRNCFISHSGAVVTPDEDGIMWYAGPKTGVKPWSIQGGLDQQALREVPSLVIDKTGVERQELLGAFLRGLAQNLGDPGMALCITAWAMSCAYSDTIFDRLGLFPFLFLHGRHGRGKTNIIRWVLDLYGMRDLGYSTLPQLKSGVGVARKAAYYASLPMAIDEVRADRTATEFYGTFRSWYNRTARPMGAKEESSVRVQEVRSTFIFGGQDTFTDPALRSRCVNLNIPVAGRDLVESYRWMEANRRDFSAIGYNWILEASTIDSDMILKAVQTMHREFLDRGLDARSAEVWGVVGFFARILKINYLKDFDIDGYITDLAINESEDATHDDIILQFFNVIEGLMVGERPVITGDHVKVDGGKLYIWFAEAFRLVNRQRSGAEETFSKGAILSALREEPYFMGEEREAIGLGNTRRRSVVFDLSHEELPDVLESIADSTGRV